MHADPLLSTDSAARNGVSFFLWMIAELRESVIADARGKQPPMHADRPVSGIRSAWIGGSFRVPPRSRFASVTLCAEGKKSATHSGGRCPAFATSISVRYCGDLRT